MSFKQAIYVVYNQYMSVQEDTRIAGDCILLIIIGTILVRDLLLFLDIRVK